MGGWFVPIISRPGVGTLIALEVTLPRAGALRPSHASPSPPAAATTGAAAAGLPAIGVSRGPGDAVKDAAGSGGGEYSAMVTGVALGTGVAPSGAAADADDEIAALLALIGGGGGGQGAGGGVPSSAEPVALTAAPRAAASAAAPTSAPPAGRAVSVLIVEDDPLLVSAALRMMGALCLDARAARSMDEAVDAFTRAADAGAPPDLVFMDMQLGDPRRVRALEACGFGLCHKYILYLYLYLDLN